MNAYEQMRTAFKALPIPFAESEWATRPAGDYGVFQLDFEASALNGDGEKIERAFSGSVDLFMKGAIDTNKTAQVEDVLRRFCGASFRMNSIQYEGSTGLTHVEWVFET